VEPIQQPTWQVPPLQTCPVPHDLPLLALLQLLTEVLGWQVRQASPLLLSPKE
jgi:hypothetical protein